MTNPVRCPSCKEASPTVLELGHCGFDDCRGHVEGYERALLERDIAEVERTIVQWTKDAASLDAYADAGDDTKGLGWACRHDAGVARRRVSDCQAWLTRARAALS